MEKYWKVRNIITWLFRTASRLEIEGVENVPSEGGCLLAVNHTSRLDTPALMVASPRRVYPLVASKYRTFPGFNWLLNVSEAIWIRRFEFDREALLKAMDVLRRGDVLGVAPEGTRSPTASLQKGKAGAAFLAARAGVPVVPTASIGTHTMLRDFTRLRRMKIRVIFGEAFHLPKEGKLSAEELESASNLIMERIAVLLPPEYRGVYADVAVDQTAS